MQIKFKRIIKTVLDFDSGNCINRIKDKRFSGQITVYASLSIVLILSLICTCIKSADAAWIKSEIEAACILSSESVFAEYCNKMVEEYDIFLLKNSDSLNAKLNEYLTKNCSNISDKVQLISSEFTDRKMITDNGGEYLLEEVTAFMDYAIYPELLEQITGSQKNSKKAQAVNEVTDEIIACQEGIDSKDKYILKMVSTIEGIKTTDSGFAAKKDLPVVTGKDYVKQILSESISMESAAISDKRVYTAIEQGDGSINADEIISGMIDCINEYLQILKEKGEKEAANICQPEYERSYDLLNKKVSGANDKIKEALQYIENYEKQSVTSKTDLSQCEIKLEENRQYLDLELYQSIRQDIDDMNQQNDRQKNSLCDVDKIKQALLENKNVIENIYKQLNRLFKTLNSEGVENQIDVLKQLKNEISKYDISELLFDYSDVSFENDGEGIGKIKDLYNNLKKGVSGIVLDGMEISDKSVEELDNTKPLTSRDSCFQSSEKSNYSIGDKIKSQLLYNEYLFMKFNTFSDYVKEDETIDTDTGKMLDYMLEYILCGNKDDKSNIESTIIKMSLIREGVNMSYLIVDVEKRTQAFEMALGLVGFTGNMAIVKAAQYTIMAAWAYAESIVDVKKLFHGHKLELIKNADNWELSLENLLDIKWEDIKTDTKTENKNSERGLDYKQYLKVLLMLENVTDKYYQTMAAMEIRMEELGKNGFRMKDYICMAKGQAKFEIYFLNQVYTKEIQYKYM